MTPKQKMVALLIIACLFLPAILFLLLGGQAMLTYLVTSFGGVVMYLQGVYTFKSWTWLFD